MGSPKASPSKKSRQDKPGVDVRHRLQALASKSSVSDARKLPSNRSSDSHRTGKDRSRNDKHSSGRDSSMERVMERARTEGGSKWTKRLLDEEAKDPERWGHSGFKEMYKSELGISKSHSRRSRSRSREKANIQIRVVRRSKSRDRSNGKRLTGRSGYQRHDGAHHSNRSRKRSHSSSDRSRIKRPTTSNNGKVKQERLSPIKKERVSPRKHSRDKNLSAGAKSRLSTRRGPSSPPERSRSRSVSDSMPSPRLRGRRNHRHSDSSSSRSRSSSLSRSSSASSSSSADSSSSDGLATDRKPLKRLSSKPAPLIQLDSHGRARMKQEEIPVTKLTPHKTKQPTTKRRPRSESSSNASDSNSGEDIMEEGEYDGKDHRKDGPSGSAKDTKTEPSSTRLSLSERFGKLAQLSSQRRNLDQLVQLKIVTPVTGAGPGEKNVSVDETSAAPVIPGLRAAVMSNRLMELIPRQPTVPQHHPLPAMTNMQPPEEIIPHLMKDDRAREEVDKWRDWHDRYRKYRRIRPPRRRPRDWDDIRVRHKYYTDKGFFGHDMTLEELMRWEEWWESYLEWRLGYKQAWIETHGPHVPVEYPDGTVQESDHFHNHLPVVSPGHHEPVGMHPPHHHHHHHQTHPVLPLGPGPMTSTSNVRSRLGWRR